MPMRNSGTTLTASEVRLISAVIQHTTADPVCDWAAVAADAGYSNAANAKTMYRRFKQNLIKRTSGKVDPNSLPTSSLSKAPLAKGKRTLSKDIETDSKAKRSKVDLNRTSTKGSQIVSDESEEEDGHSMGIKPDAVKILTKSPTMNTKDTTKEKDVKAAELEIEDEVI